jgi:hypothetical protein
MRAQQVAAEDVNEAVRGQAPRDQLRLAHSAFVERHVGPLQDTRRVAVGLAVTHNQNAHAASFRANIEDQTASRFSSSEMRAGGRPRPKSTSCQSQILGDFPELLEGGASFRAGRADGLIKAMADMIVDQRFLGVVDRVLDGLKLLGELQTRPPLFDHVDDHVQVTVGALEALDDVGMRVVGH